MAEKNKAPKYIAGYCLIISFLSRLVTTAWVVLSSLQVMEETGHSILDRVPQPIPVGVVMEKHPVRYEESMNTVLIQEVIRYNRLLATVRQTLNDLLKALKGLVVMSQALETMANSLYNNSVPELWAGKVGLSSLITDTVKLGRLESARLKY